MKKKNGLERVENSVWKGENAGYQHFLLFPLCFQKASSPRVLEAGIFIVKGYPFPNKPWFLRVCSTSLFIKTLWEKEKLLVTSNFSFSHSVFFFTSLKNFLLFSSISKLSSADSFSMEESKICRLGKG